MTTTAIIINTTENISSISEYERYFDNVYVAKSITELNNFFELIDSDYLVIVTDNEYYAEDCYVLCKYFNSHNMDFIVGNRINTTQYLDVDNFYRRCNKTLSKKLSKLTNKYIPDIFSFSYVLSKKFYKRIKVTSNFQLDCLRYSKNFVYIDIRYKPQQYSKIDTYKYYSKAKKYRKDAN